MDFIDHTLGGSTAYNRKVPITKNKIDILEIEIKINIVIHLYIVYR